MNIGDTITARDPDLGKVSGTVITIRPSGWFELRTDRGAVLSFHPSAEVNA